MHAERWRRGRLREYPARGMILLQARLAPAVPLIYRNERQVSKWSVATQANSSRPVDLTTRNYSSSCIAELRSRILKCYGLHL